MLPFMEVVLEVLLHPPRGISFRDKKGSTEFGTHDHHRNGWLYYGQIDRPLKEVVE